YPSLPSFPHDALPILAPVDQLLFFTSGQVDCSSGWKASAAGIVATSLARSHSCSDSAGVLTSYRYMSWTTRPSGRIEALRITSRSEEHTSELQSRENL